MTTASQLLCRTYARYSKFPEFIDYSGAKRLLRPDHDKFRIDLAYDFCDRLTVVCLDRVDDLLAFLVPIASRSS
jgi:hypothetical protein